jgi:hypothetical protein
MIPLPFRCSRRRLAAFAAALALGGCHHDEAPTAVDAGRRDAAPASEPGIPADAVGRAGPVVLDLAGLRDAVEEARVLQFWRSGAAPDVNALQNPMLRQRLVEKALQTRVIRAEGARRGLAVPPERLHQALEDFAAGRPVDAPVPEPAPDPSTLDARLAARYGTTPDRARQVVVDLLQSGLLAEALLDETPEDRLRRAWEDEQTQLRVDLVLVPRVPTSGEIDRAVRERADAVKAFYEAHLDRFQKPERVVARRVVVPVPAGADAAAREAARKRAEALRARVAGGEDLKKVAATESVEAERRRGGLVGPWTRETAPELFGVAPGQLSSVVACRQGWTFFRIETHVPASTRPLDDPTVQGEIAAEILRTEDVLPHARDVAERVRALLRAAPGGADLDRLVHDERLTRQTTPPFNRAAQRVPGIGLSPELFEAVFRLTPAAPVTEVVTVRQNYVVARQVELHTPDPAAWPAAKAGFTAQWRTQQRPFVVDNWLAERLRGQPLWVDGKRLDALTLQDLGVKAP